MSRRSDEETIQAILDGKLDAREFEAFERRLLAEPELRELYRSYGRMTHVLEEKFAHSEPSVVPFTSRPNSRKATFAIAACAAGLGIASLFIFNPAESSASVQLGPESHGRVVHTTGQVKAGAMVKGSVIELDHGSASVTLPSGAQAYFEGPGSLEYQGDDHFHLQEGRVWFENTDASQQIVCTTADLRVDAPAGEFGVISEKGKPQELHVLRGEVLVTSPDQHTSRLGGGHSAYWANASLTTSSSASRFSAGFPQAVAIFSENFDDPDLTPLAGKHPDIGAGPWTVERGGPVIKNGVLDTSGNLRHTAFAPLGGAPLDELSHVLLVTLVSEDPQTSRFHSEGWAGVSLYTGDQERIFVGDPNGPEEGWGLHPVGYEARHACPLLAGKNTVTMRYDYRSGLAQLFEGTETTGPALASEWISPGLSFDRLRIANGSQADAAVDAGKDASAAGEGEGVEIRGDIALRQITVTVLSAEQEIRSAQP
ncbi:anti-sigma factor family protein [Haloferula sp.]|uniref:anti-sigma factor family protein n=1 Tax=Haloferula sp. TaxID=2497595 RepID=UPI003C71F7AF